MITKKENDTNYIEKILNKKFSSRFKKDLEFKQVTTFGIGGKIRYFVDVLSIKESVFLVRFCRTNNIPFFVLGGGSNVLASDKGFNGLVICTLKMNGIKFRKSNLFNSDKKVSPLKTNLKEKKQESLLMSVIDIRQENSLTKENFLIKQKNSLIEKEKINFKQDHLVEVQSGVRLSTLVVESAKQELGGLEWVVGIPGTVGGATLMNAGAFGGQMSDKIVSVTYFDGKKIKKSRKEDLVFEYRSSSFKKIKDIIIFLVCFRLEYRNREEIQDNIKKITEKRLATQKVGYPSAGSVFKRLPHITAAEMIDQAGLKGTQIGGAMVSKVHSGYIVNVGGATCRDVRKLIDFISKSVYNKFIEKLELEIILVGEEDE